MRLLLLPVLLTLSINAFSQRPLPKKAFGVTVSFPWINNFAYYHYDQSRSTFKTGFSGLGASGFYKDQVQKISLSLGIIGSIPVPFGPFDYEAKNITFVHGTFLEGAYHRRVHPRINLIGGMHYMEHAYNHFTDTMTNEYVDDFTGGLTLGAEYLFSRKNFSLALFYRPSLVTFTGTRKYRHVISLDARFDINIFRKY